MKKYEESIKYLGLSQKYIARIMDEDLPNRNYVFDQVKEVDEETEREPSPLRTNTKVNKLEEKLKNTLKPQGLTYYDTSDSESIFPESIPMDQSMTYNSKKDKLNINSKFKESRLSQLSKFNLFALIELANACLIIKLYKDLDQALQICNEAIMTLKMLGEKVGTSIIAQELLELLVSQIMDHKTEELETDDKDNPIFHKESSQGMNADIDNNLIPKGLIIASSEEERGPTIKSPRFQKENIDNDDVPANIMSRLNTRSILNSKDFHSVMAITTLVPFIKPGVPRLSSFDVKEAKLYEKDAKNRKLVSSKLFMDNLIIREEIVNFRSSHQNNTLREKSKTPNPNFIMKIEDRKEMNNIINNPELKNSTENENSSMVDIESDLK